MPYWYWNGRITPTETRRQIQEMIDQGVYQAVVFPWDGMELRYLSEDYWTQFGAALAIAKELKFTLNFADEYDWPSGHAWDVKANKPELSRVLIEHPEYRMMRLKYSEAIVEGPATALPRPEHAIFTVAGRVDGKGQPESATLQLIDAGWTPPAGKWLVTSYELVPSTGGHNTRVDLLNPAAVDTFLEMVYGEYARRFSKYFGNTLQLTLADHEGSYGSPIAYTPLLWDVFRQRHGYDLRAVLPLLVHDAAGDRRAQEVRRDYLDTISHLYVTSFTGKVAEWCRRHKLQHATSLYEEQLFSRQVKLETCSGTGAPAAWLRSTRCSSGRACRSILRKPYLSRTSTANRFWWRIRDCKDTRHSSLSRRPALEPTCRFCGGPTA